MREIAYIPVERLRKSPYNPRMVHDQQKAKALLKSIAEEGVREPLLVWLNKQTGEYEVLDGSRRLWAARENNIHELPCIVLEADERAMKRTSLAVHLTQEDLTPEEVVAFIDRLVGEEEFRSVDEVCRYLGLSKQWYYELRKAARLRRRIEDPGSLPVSTLAVIESADIPGEKKQQLIQELERTPLPRAAVRQVVEQLERNQNLTPREAVEQQLEREPKKIHEGFVEAEGRYIYQLRRTDEAYTLTAKTKEGKVVGELAIPREDIGVVRRIINEAL